MRVHFTHLGCKLNQAETEALSRRFLAAGHRLAPSLAEADLHVINSCTVTAAAARDSRRAAHRSGRHDPSAHPPETPQTPETPETPENTARPARRLLTVMTGCFATVEPGAAARLQGVDLVVPNHEKDRLLERVHEAFPGALPGSGSAEVPLLAAPPPVGCTRALVKVEDGCNMRCAFCIIPSTRGRQRSRPLAEVVAEVRALVAAGHREVVVTGVQISAWRQGRCGLSELVGELLAALPARGARLRLTSIAPWDLEERLLARWADGRLCRHLHLSLQSGSAATLARMRRPYTPARYEAAVKLARSAIPGVAVTTDVIVGFPGETEAEFAASLALVAALGFAKVHVFPFSPRPGTEAARLPDGVPAPVKAERMVRMLEVSRRAELEFWRAHLGQRATVLWERPREGSGRGLTDNYIRVLSPEGAALWNRLTEVELVATTGAGMLARIVT